MKKKYDDDDGRTIANMNVEGMPWYRPGRSEKSVNKGSKVDLTKKERIGLYLGIFKAVSLVAIVFVGVFFLLILILTRVWG